MKKNPEVSELDLEVTFKNVPWKKVKKILGLQTLGHGDHYLT